MKHIIATTDRFYFRWQMLVQINNFKKLGILDDVTYVVSVKYKISDNLKLIKETTGARIITYRDDRDDKIYSPSIRPHILKKHFKKYPKEGKMFFYLDPDVIFTKKPIYPTTYYKTNKWILSDTKSYINSKYIIGKSEELFELMCKVVNIKSDLVKRYDNFAGGAQYIIKNSSIEYWDSVEKDSVELYRLMSNTKNKYSPEKPIQSWTACMWGMLWNSWKYGHRTLIDEGLKFSWATDKISNWDKNFIYHNAGVSNEKNLFNKCLFSTKNPFNEDLTFVSNKHCSYNYVKEIEDTKKNYSELINKL